MFNSPAGSSGIGLDRHLAYECIPILKIVQDNFPWTVLHLPEHSFLSAPAPSCPDLVPEQ